MFWLRRWRFLHASAAAIGVPFLGHAAAVARDGPVDLIVTADTIHTVEPDLHGKRAFAVRDGRFAYVGSRDGALALRGAKTEIVELGRATVLPGLIDAHLHLTWMGAALGEVDLFHAASFEEVVRT